MIDINNQEPVVIEFSYTENDYGIMGRFIYFSNKPWAKVFVTLFMIIGIIYPLCVIYDTLMMILDGNTTQLFSALSWLVVYFTLIGYLAYRHFYGYRDSYRKHPHLSRRLYRYEFHSLFILLKISDESAFSETKVDYYAIRFVIETPTYFILSQSKRIRHYLPKREIPSSDQEKLSSLFKLRYQSRYTIRRKP